MINGVAFRAFVLHLVHTQGCAFCRKILPYLLGKETFFSSVCVQHKHRGRGILTRFQHMQGSQGRCVFHISIRKYEQGFFQLYVVPDKQGHTF